MGNDSHSTLGNMVLNTGTRDGGQSVDLRPIQARLKFYDGGHARLWRFMPSHGHLAIELSDHELKNPNYLIMLGTTLIKAPTGWRIGALDLATNGGRQGHDEFVLRDAEVEIRCAWEVQLRDDYAP